MNTKFTLVALFMLCSGLLNAGQKPLNVQVIVMDERPIGSPTLYVGYKMGIEEQSPSINVGKIEIKSSNNPVSNKFMVPNNAKAMTFDTMQKTTGNFSISYQAGQGYKLNGISSVSAVFKK